MMTAELTTSEAELSGDLTPIDLNELKRYAPAESGGGSYTTPPPGAYKVRLPNSLPEASFEVKTAASGVRYLQITLDNQLKGDDAEGLVIVDGPFAGQSARYVRISTLMQTAKRWNNGAMESVLDAEGNERRFSDAIDLLANAGVSEVPQSVEGWKAALRALEGVTLPHTVYLGWEGSAKGEKENGYPRRVRQNEFKRTDGSFESFLTLTAQTPFEDKRKGRAFTVNPGETYRVYPNLKVGRRGFAPKSN
jgi:hypothetical protein